MPRSIRAHRSLRAAHRAPFAMTLLGLVAAQAGAQTVPAPSDAASAAPALLQSVTVTGKALSAKRTIADKRSQSVISDGVSSDEIGSIPDFGLGEALQRVPGVSMILNNGRGEAQFMTLRGFNPDYNSVLVDGVSLPSTETTRRIISLDVIPSSMVKQATVYKTFTPEMEGNAVGGITNLQTRSAFDKPGLQLGGRADLSDWTDRRHYHDTTPSGQLEATGSNTFGADDRFGFLLSGSYYRRDSSSLNTSVDSYSYYANTGSKTNASKLGPTQNVDGAVAVPDRIRWLSYDNIRQRRSVFGKFEFDDREQWRAHATLGAFQHLNDEDRRAQWLQNTTTSTSALNITSATSGTVASGQAQSDYAKYDQNRKIRYAEAGAEYQPSADRLIDVSLNRAGGTYRQDAKLYTFATANSPNLAYSYNYTPGGIPTFTPNNTSYWVNPANYNQTENTTQVETSSNWISTLKLNFAQNMQEDATGWGFKAGGQVRDLNQLYNFDELKYVPKTGTAISMAAVGAAPFNVNPYSGNGTALLLPDPNAAQAYFNQNPGSYALASTNAQNSTQKDFSIQENIGAGYVMGTYRAARWSSVFGARYERTATTVNTFVATPANQTATYAASSTSQTYGKLLPSVNFSYELDDTLRLRGAASQSLARPTYAQLGQNTSSVTGTTITQTLANPGLAPRESTNLDLSLEWYRTRDSLVSLGLFHKSIRNEIASLTTTQSSTIGGTVYTVNASQAQNVGDAKVNGVELGLIQPRFDALPAPFNQFGTTFNLMLLAMNPATITMSDGSQRQMPSLMESPRSVANASLLWGSGPLSAQLAYNWTNKTLITLSTTNSAQDVYYKAMGTADAQFAYQLDKRTTFRLQAKNFTNARPTRVTGPNQGLLNQEIDNGRAFFAGVSYAL